MSHSTYSKNSFSDYGKDQAEGLRKLVERQKTTTRFVSIVSGKGGVGKSSFCLNLAVALSKLGIRVLVVDADFGLANIDVMLGINTRANLGHFINGTVSLDDIIQIGHGNVRFISGGSGVYELLNANKNHVQKLVTQLMTLKEPVDLVLFDVGAGINENVIELALASCQTIVVTTPEPTAILDAYALIKTLALRDDLHEMMLVMNKCDNAKDDRATLAAFEQVIKQHLNIQIKSLGCIAHDMQVIQSIKRQTPIMLSNPDSLASQDIDRIAHEMVNVPFSQDSNKGFFSRMVNRLIG